MISTPLLLVAATLGMLSVCSTSQLMGMLERLGVPTSEIRAGEQRAGRLFVLAVSFVFVFIILATTPEAQIILSMVDAMGFDAFAIFVLVQMRDSAISAISGGYQKTLRLLRFARAGCKLTSTFAYEQPVAATCYTLVWVGFLYVPLGCSLL